MTQTPINESSLSRLYQSNVEHDCGALTAWRKTFTKSERRARNRSLLAKLMVLKYQVTAIHGDYPEVDPKTGHNVLSKEESFFVVDIHDRDNLEKDLRHLGEEFEQDSILFLPKGAVTRQAGAVLIGTNRSGYPGLGHRLPFERGRFGYTSPIYTSYNNGRPFIFESVGDHYDPPTTGFGIWGAKVDAERAWRQFLDTL